MLNFPVKISMGDATKLVRSLARMVDRKACTFISSSQVVFESESGSRIVFFAGNKERGAVLHLFSSMDEDLGQIHSTGWRGAPKKAVLELEGKIRKV